jgi:hypothetical protein
VNTIRPSGQGDVSTVIDHDPHTAASCPTDDPADHLAQDARVEVPLSHLDHVDACINGLSEKMLERRDRLLLPRVRRQPASVRDETDHGIRPVDHG